MKKFAFSLERVLTFKRTIYEKEKNLLSQMRAQRAALVQKRDNTIAQVIEMDENFRGRAVDGVRISDVTGLSYHKDNASKMVKQLKIEIATWNDKIAKQVRVVVELDQDVKGLEKLREKQWEEYRAGAAIEEQERVLEIISTKYMEDQRVAEI